MRSSYLGFSVNPLVVKLAISLAILAVVFYVAPLSAVANAVSQAKPFWIVVGILLQICLRIITALRMQAIANAQAIDTKSFAMVRIVFASTLYNLLAPGAVAGGAVTFLKYRQEGICTVPAVANIYANKVIEILVIALFSPLFWLIDQGFSASVIGAYGFAMCAAFSAAWGMVFGRQRTLLWLTARLRRYGPPGISPGLVNLSQQIALVGQSSTQTLAGLVGSSVMYGFVAALALACYGMALDLQIELVQALWVFSVIYLAAILPISISNLGVREAAMIFLLAPYAIAPAEAIAWSALMYAGPLSCALIGAMLDARYYGPRNARL